MCLYVLSSVLLISFVFLCCPVMCLYVLNSVLLISLAFFVLSCYVSVCSEFRVAHFFSFVCAVLLCIFMFWVPCCSFLLFFLCCPVMYLYVLSSVLLISFVFFVLSCYVSLCSEFRVAHFFSFFVLSCYVSLCSEFRVAYFFSFFPIDLLCVFMFWVPCCSFL